jgi:RNase P/RNase MRP subunit p30
MASLFPSHIKRDLVKMSATSMGRILMILNPDIIIADDRIRFLKPWRSCSMRQFWRPDVVVRDAFVIAGSLHVGRKTRRRGFRNKEMWCICLSTRLASRERQSLSNVILQLMAVKDIALNIAHHKVLRTNFRAERHCIDFLRAVHQGGLRCISKFVGRISF